VPDGARLRRRKEHYEAFLRQAAKADLRRFADPGLQYDAVQAEIEDWRNESFTDERKRASGLGVNLFHLLRHLGQAGGQSPPFFPFEHREEHDLSPTAKVAAVQDWGPKRTRQHLEGIYLDERRFWHAMYPRFDLFCDQFRRLVEGDIQRTTGAGGTVGPGDVIAPPLPLPVEMSEEEKQAIIRRDGERCLCCGNTRRLQVDHIKSRYHRGTNDRSNLQTLCSICNHDKGIQEMYFRNTETLLKSVPPMRFPAGFDSTDLDHLRHDVQRTINMFYQCAAVDEIEMKKRGIKRREWRIRLRSNNPGGWLKEHLVELFERVRAAQASDRSGPVRSIVLETPNISDGSISVFRVDADESGTAKTASATEIRSRMSNDLKAARAGARMEGQDWAVGDKVAVRWTEEVDGVEQDMIYDPCTVVTVDKKRGVFDGYTVAFPPNEKGEVEAGEIDADRVVGPSKAHG